VIGGGTSAANVWSWIAFPAARQNVTSAANPVKILWLASLLKTQAKSIYAT
jgi:hypothetical protein